MSRWQITTTACAISVALCGQARAATITIIPTAGATYDAVTGANVGAGFLALNSASIYRVDVFALVNGASATEAFGAVSFDLVLGGSALRNTLQIPGSGLINPKTGWSSNRPTGPMTGIADDGGNPISDPFVGGQNGDLGISTTDLLAITVAIDPSNLGKTINLATGDPIHDPRLDLGKSTPFLLGNIYVLRSDPTNVGSVTLQNGSYSIADAATHSFRDVVPLPSANLLIPVQIPEPASFTLLLLGGLGLFGLRWRRNRS